MIRRLVLRNWRAYDHLELDLEPGATFVVAPNGVGKSSIVEGARFALFGLVPPARDGAARVSQAEPASAAVDVELPSGRVLHVDRQHPARARAATTPTVLLDGAPYDAAGLDALLAEEFGAEPAFLARLAMLHSSGVFGDAKGIDLRAHLSQVFGVDGLVAAIDQTKALAQAAKKTVDAARKTPVMPDDELAALGELETRAAELTEAADAEREEAERALLAARTAGEASRLYEQWRAIADAYTAAATDVATAAGGLLGRDVAVDTIAAELDAAEAATVAALDDVRRRRAELAGRQQAIRTGLAELDDAGGSCPVCRRPLDAADVDTARAGHEQELAALDTELAATDEDEPVRVVTALRGLRTQLQQVPVPGPTPPAPPDDAAVTEADALVRFDEAVALAAERRGILTEARRRRESGEAARVELEAVTSAFERAAALEAAGSALEAARQRILTESIEPIEDMLAESWQSLFADRAGLGLRGDGGVVRRIGDAELDYEHFSDGEKMVTQLLLRVLVLRATTRLSFFWVDEPLEHLDPDARRALAVLLAQAPEGHAFRQVLVTTYEEPLARRLRATIPSVRLVYVRPSAADVLTG